MHLPQAQDIIKTVFYFTATTKGRWGKEELHEVLNNLQAACKGAWQPSPYLKTFCVF